MLQCNLKESTKWSSAREEKCLFKKKDKDRKYLLSYPTLTITHVKAICGLHFVTLEFYSRGQNTKRDSHLLFPFLNQPLTYKPTGSQWQWISVPVKVPLLNLQNTLNDLLVSNWNIFLHISNNLKYLFHSFKWILLLNKNKNGQKQYCTSSQKNVIVYLFDY